MLSSFFSVHFHSSNCYYLLKRLFTQQHSAAFAHGTKSDVTFSMWIMCILSDTKYYKAHFLLQFLASFTRHEPVRVILVTWFNITLLWPDIKYDTGWLVSGDICDPNWCLVCFRKSPWRLYAVYMTFGPLSVAAYCGERCWFFGFFYSVNSSFLRLVIFSHNQE